MPAPASIPFQATRPGQPIGFQGRGPWSLYQKAAVLGLSFALVAGVEAGDLLRGGAPMHGGSGGTAGPSVAGAATTARARAKANDALSRTSAAIQSVQAMQAAARSLAAARSSVPNGLKAGGLQVAPGVPLNLAKPAAGEDASLWSGAALPTQRAGGNGKTTVTIKQTGQQAVLTWKTFNIGKDTTLSFDQSAGGANVGQWIAFNKINDPSGAPSQILGAINAPGQVYVINRNGIIFGGTAQINTHALVASTLPINEHLLARGILNNPNYEFLFQTPTMTDAAFALSEAVSTYRLAGRPVSGSKPQVSYTAGTIATKLAEGIDYTTSLDAGGNTVLSFKAATIAATGGAPVSVTYYTSRSGDVRVEKGARLSAPSTAAKIGGRIALIASNVTNAGTISTPDGQTILAAGQQVGLVAHESGDPSLRGLDVYVGVADRVSGTASNSGFIEARRGAVTLVGKTVNQLGAIESTTSVSLNGRIDLLANFESATTVVLNKPRFSPFASGTVNLGAGSVTRILPEMESRETVTGTRLSLASQINLQAKAIHLAAGAEILAPSAHVSLEAGNWRAANGESAFIFDGGQIYLEKDALINVAGVGDVSAQISENIIELQLRGAELADAPAQRTGVLRGTALHIDLRESGIYNGIRWIGTPLGDVSGYAGLIERTVGELSTGGGTVQLKAGEAVILQQGSKIDVSGGWTNFQGGVVETSRVLSEGRLLGISQATPDRVYDGLYTGVYTRRSAKWGVTENYTNPLLLSGKHYEPGYTQGADGGTIALSAPSMALDGRLLGQTVAGARQRDAMPVSSTLSLAFRAQSSSGPLFSALSPTPPAITFQTLQELPAAEPFALDENGNPLSLRAERKARVTLSPDLVHRDGFGSLTIDNPEGNLTLPAGVALTPQTGRSAQRRSADGTLVLDAQKSPILIGGGNLAFSAANIDIQGRIEAASGNLSFSVYNYSPLKFAILKDQPNAATPIAAAGRGLFRLGARAVLSTAGLLVDEAAPGGLQRPTGVDGGSIAISTYSGDFQSGGLLDASGGVRLAANGQMHYGKGGSIAILSGQDPGISSLLGGTLALESTLKAFGGPLAAGSLKLQAALIQIGGAASKDTLVLAPEFFSQGGFGSFELNGLGARGAKAGEFSAGLVIAQGTVLEPLARSWQAAALGKLSLESTLLPEALRTPVSLKLTAAGVKDSISSTLSVRGDLRMEADTVIRTGPGADVMLNANTVEVLGSISAPAGGIHIQGGNDSVPLYLDATQALTTVHLGSESVLSTAGATVLTANAYGYRTGRVLDGGDIQIGGNLVLEAGALLDVSGSRDVLDTLPAYTRIGTAINGLRDGRPVVPFNSGINAPLFNSIYLATRVESSAGSITLTGGQQLYSDATLKGEAGGPSARGGTLTISSGRFYVPDSGVPAKPTDITLIVTQSGSTRGASGRIVLGRPVRDSAGKTATGTGHFSADRFIEGGFDSLKLGGTVQFVGPVKIAAANSLNIADGGVIYGNGRMELIARYIALGTPFQAPLQAQDQTAPFVVGGQAYTFAPTFGSGSLEVSAELIDIGNLSLQNIGKAHFRAANGDIRGEGTLNVAGAITLEAGQIYPPSAVSFTIAASDYKIGGVTHGGSVRIVGSGSRQLPLSAGGELNVYASTIEQGGVLRAPLGSIHLGWDGTGTAPKNAMTGASQAVTAHLTLGAGSLTSVSAIDPLNGQAALIPYGINANGTAWIDPTGLDITIGGTPSKSVVLSAAQISSERGSVLDIQGGGDLYAYRWIKGLGGSRDVLLSTLSFAILPDYQASYAPFAPFGTGASAAAQFGNDPGYTNAQLRPGDRIYLGASAGLPAGTYTLLPARYALLPGAFLVTPHAGVPAGSILQNDGSTLVPGYRLGPTQSAAPLTARFEVASATVVRARSQYEDFSGNVFLRGDKESGAQSRLAADAGHLILEATRGMTFRGSLMAGAATGNRGGLVDISSPVDIVIGNSSTVAPAGSLLLDASELTAFGAESLLIGGVRQESATGTTVTIHTGHLTLSNAGAPLSAPDIILVATKNLTLAPGAELIQKGALSAPAGTLFIGQSATPDSGDGTLLRVSSDPAASLVRSGVGLAGDVTMTIGAGAILSGNSLTLDSTAATQLDPSARLHGRTISLNSGQISLVLGAQTPIPESRGLVLSGGALANLNRANELSLLSYSSIDIHGTGNLGSASMQRLALHAAAIGGFDNEGGSVTIKARTILLDNSPAGMAPAFGDTQLGTLIFNAQTLQSGVNALAIGQFATVDFNASRQVSPGKTGSLSVQGDLRITTPLVTASTGANQSIAATGTLDIKSPGGRSTGGQAAGLGATLSLSGASVNIESPVLLASGSLRITASSGDLTIRSRLDVSGTARAFFDEIKYTDAGQITLIATHGQVDLAPGSVLDLSAQKAGGKAGTLSISAIAGDFTLDGSVHAEGGSFNLDANRLDSLAALNAKLNAAGLSRSRTLRVRTGDVLIDGFTSAHEFNLSADTGSITVSGSIDASGSEGGTIGLEAFGNVTLLAGSHLSVAAQTFNAAGKGGAVRLETRGNNAGTIDLQSGSDIDLSVAAANDESAALGQLGGTLHLRAPQNAAGTDLAISPMAGTILGASKITAEGYKIYNLSVTTGTITTAIQNSIRANGNSFLGSAGTSAAGYSAMLARLLNGQTALEPVLVITPGAEIIHTTGDLTLGATNSTASSDWNLAPFRFGPTSAPGILTLRAAGNLVFFNALSDGFTTSAYTSALLAQNPLLPLNAQAWSYRLVAGADFTAADFSDVRTQATLGANSGSLQLGKNAGLNISNPVGNNATTSTALLNRYQVIRTGSGDIDISAGRSVQLLNQFATIYTAGTQVADATPLPGGGAFDTPILGVGQAQYTLAGGNVSISAQADILHQTRNNALELIADSGRELPMNWLYRRGYVDAATGEFGTAVNGDVASTSWWVDFTNFFQGVGALGGGNVTLKAGNDIANVDALIPTNARMAKGKAKGQKLVELGGGDLTIEAGRDLDGGVYYIERGRGALSAGGSIHSNSTRSPSLTTLKTPNEINAPETWLPTTLFLGKGSFDVSARGDLLLGPVANPFLLPGGLNNSFAYKTYFSTYAPTNSLTVSSLGGQITLRESATLPTAGAGAVTPLLQAWFQKELLLSSAPQSASFYQPWLRLNETSVAPFGTVSSLLPGTLRVTAFGGDINVVGALTLAPSPTGTLELFATGAINGLQPNGSTTLNGVTTRTWGAARINLSDANPDTLPQIDSPYAYQSLVGASSRLLRQTRLDVLIAIDALFNESGSSEGDHGVLQNKQTLHSPGVLHANDPDPLRIYANSGDISGLTLFSPKATRLLAGRDINDIALYLQNTGAADLSLVASGRDLTAYDSNSTLRAAARATGNVLNFDSATLAGDIQISGHGSLEVLAGRNLDLGVGPNNSDGTAVGITSIGNARNPYLPFEGADIVAGAGMGGAASLGANARVGVRDFIANILTPEVLERYLPELAGDLSAVGFSKLPGEEQAARALDIFYLLLRDAGRTHATTGNYEAGFAAIDALFPGTQWMGDITLTSREIKTRNGGNISVFAPGGSLTVGVDAGANQAIDQGLLTESGGNISIFTKGSMNVGTSRIFTLRGGHEILWSSTGDIAAGAASKTVQSAPPTRVLIDPQSGDVKTDLAGLATGGGIGVLATVAGVPAGDVDLVAPAGTIDAGDAGIRVSGNLNIAANVVLNADNIQVSGSSVGTPVTAAVAAPNISGLTAASSSAGAAAGAADETTQKSRPSAGASEELPSIISVEVISYGGGEE